MSAPLGALFGFMFDGARVTSQTPRALLHGAVIAMVAAFLATLMEILFHARLERMPGGLSTLIRMVLFTVAGGFGFVFGGGMMRMLLWNLPFRIDSRVAYPMIIASLVAAAIGLAFYTFERMRDRLRESISQLKEQEFAAKELEIARSIQQRLLPPEEVSGDGYRISARNLAARFVAGDFYDVFHLSDGSVGAVVADVSGKGVGASLIMASAKAVLPLIAEGRGVAEAMRELNVKLARELGRREFVALAYARLNPATGELQVANAGLPDPYLIRNGSARPIHVPGTRLPLGAMKNATYECASLRLEAGDRFLMLTDGLPEATASDGEAVGYERLPELLCSGERELSTWLTAVIGRLRENTAEHIEDDWTALAIERA